MIALLVIDMQNAFFEAPELAAPNVVVGVAGTDTLLEGRETDAPLERSGV